MNTVDALLREITAKPEDDTLRLAMADYYDGEAGEAWVKCPRCKGSRHLLAAMTRDGKPQYGHCPTCGGRGEVNHNAERAEFIRLQVELAVTPSKGHGKGQYHREKLRARERELTAALGSRLSAPCPGCKGHGRQWTQEKDLSDSGYYGPTCETCGSAGDLYKFDGGARHSTYGSTRLIHVRRPHHFHRGCLYLRVTLGEVLGQYAMPMSGYEYRPTPWAAALPPEVVGLWVTDREPFWSKMVKAWIWFEGDAGTHDVPMPVFDLLSGLPIPRNNPLGAHKEFRDTDIARSPTPHLAKLHLAHALRQWIYDCASRDSTTT